MRAQQAWSIWVCAMRQEDFHELKPSLWEFVEKVFENIQMQDRLLLVASIGICPSTQQDSHTYEVTSLDWFPQRQV